MNTCMDCGTQITKCAKRCKSCSIYIRTTGITKYYCKSEKCNNIVDYRTYKYGKGYCKSCIVKGIGHEKDCQCCICKTKRKEYSQKNNPNYKDGRTLRKHYCKEEGCNNEIAYGTAYFRDGRCVSCSKLGNTYCKGKHHTKETKLKISIANQGMNNSMYGTCRCGKDNPFYGGHHIEATKRLFSLIHGGTGIPYEYSEYGFKWTPEFREQIRERDNHICQLCEKRQGKRFLSVHHIDYNKKNLNPDNLISLCINCHVKTNYNREFWETVLTK